MEILKVENLTKIYGKDSTKVVALDHVSFSVEKGEFVENDTVDDNFQIGSQGMLNIKMLKATDVCPQRLEGILAVLLILQKAPQF